MTLAGPWRAAEARAEPWFRRHPGWALAVAVVLFAGVFVLRMNMPDPVDAISYFYVFPIALVAMLGGRAGGLVAGMVGVLLVAVWVRTESVDLSVVGWLSRVLPMLLVGFVLGDASDRLESAARGREASRLAEQRHREAVEINDSLVQGMSAAKWSIEAGRVDTGLQMLEETVAQGHELVSKLIKESESSG